MADESAPHAAPPSLPETPFWTAPDNPIPPTAMGRTQGPVTAPHLVASSVPRLPPHQPAALSTPVAQSVVSAQTAPGTAPQTWQKKLVILATTVVLLAAGVFGKGVWDGYQANRGTLDSTVTTNLDPIGELLPTDAKSYRITRDYGDGAVLTISVDWASQNSILTNNRNTFEIRTIEGRGYARQSPDDEWIEVDPVPTDELKLAATDIVTSGRTKPFTVESSPTVDGGGRYVIDTAAFAANDAEYWRAWATFFTGAERVPTAGETATVEVVGLADGVLQSAVVTLLPSGETMSYTLTDVSGDPLVVDLT